MSHTMRTYFQHAAVRDCAAQAETCRLLGMKPHLSSTAQVIHSLCGRMFNARNAIPKSSTGHPVVPHYIDPYRACLVAPDHLLTGHLRDCISLALRLLPSDFYRQSCEKFMMGFLEDAALPVQNRLVDHLKQCLYGMSMTELYALSSVADSALYSGCHYASNFLDKRKPLSAKCEQALGLVSSCAKLIAELWYYPQLRRDGFNSVQQFEEGNGTSYISRLQMLVRSHLGKVVSICEMNDADVLQLDDRRCPKQRKTELSALMRETLIAIKTVDKPNVHRLSELVHTTLPLVGHIGRVGELVLEKAHQTLKRSIHLSNNKDIQLHAMSGASFADWQGRLSMLAQLATDGDQSAILGCFRLLAGREVVAALRGHLSRPLSAAVVHTLGPEQCIAAELQAQGQRVLSPRTTSSTNILTWSLIRPFRIIAGASFTQSEYHKRTLEFFQKTQAEELSHLEVHFAASASSSFTNATPGVTLRRGDILEILVYYPESPSLHFPYLAQPNGSRPIGSWMSSTGVSIWFLHDLVSLKPHVGSSTIFAAVLPCAQVQGYTVSEPKQWLPKYRVCTDRSISFARLEESVRRVGVLHDCFNSTCHPVPHRISLSHSPQASPENGGVFYTLTRKHGYPPRKG